jgi:hypothetical protein
MKSEKEAILPKEETVETTTSDVVTIAARHFCHSVFESCKH